MPRLNNAVIDHLAYNGHTNYGKRLDPRFGAQMGIFQRLGNVIDGVRYNELVSDSAHITRNLICILLEAPRFFDYMPNKDINMGVLKTLIESRPISVTGFDSELNVATVEHAVGADGSQFVQPAGTTRNRSNPTFEYIDIQGRGIMKWVDMYIRWGVEDPDTRFALVRNLIDKNDPTYDGVYTADFYSFSFIAFETDVLCKHIVDAYLCCNCFFTKSGTRTNKRDKTAPGELVTLSYEMQPITLNNREVMLFAQSILDGLDKLSILPDDGIVPTTNRIEAAIAAQERFGFNYVPSY